LRACYHPSKDMIGIRHSTLSDSVTTTPGDAQSVIKYSPATWTAVGTIVHSKRLHYRIHIYCMARQETSRVCAATGARQNAPADSYPRAKRAVHQDLGPTNRIPLFYNQWRGFHFNFCFGKRTSFLKTLHASGISLSLLCGNVQVGHDGLECILGQQDLLFAFNQILEHFIFATTGIVFSKL
jgi:hypothetical protein